MVAVTVLMIVLDVVHPPAVATGLSFAFKAESERNLVLFGLTVGLVVVLIGLQQVSLCLLARLDRRARVRHRPR